MAEQYQSMLSTLVMRTMNRMLVVIAQHIKQFDRLMLEKGTGCSPLESKALLRVFTLPLWL